jgi:hypothetical protein
MEMQGADSWPPSSVSEPPARTVALSLLLGRRRQMKLDEFVAKYPAFPSRRAPAHPDEHRPLRPADGVLELEQPPLSGPQGDAGDSRTRHLWVFALSIPYILESAPMATPKLATGFAKHTNLTGGGLASCGGELWIDSAEEGHLYVNGSSGRYGPRTKAQLEDAVEVFKKCGFRVTSFGWDDDTQLPHAVLYR